MYSLRCMAIFSLIVFLSPPTFARNHKEDTQKDKFANSILKKSFYTRLQRRNAVRQRPVDLCEPTKPLAEFRPQTSPLLLDVTAPFKTTTLAEGMALTFLLQGVNTPHALAIFEQVEEKYKKYRAQDPILLSFEEARKGANLSFCLRDKGERLLGVMNAKRGDKWRKELPSLSSIFSQP